MRRNTVKEGTSSQAKKQYKVPILKSERVERKVGQTELEKNGLREQSMGQGEVAAPDRLSLLLRRGMSSCLWCLEVCLFKRVYARLQTGKVPLVYTRNF